MNGNNGHIDLRPPKYWRVKTPTMIQMEALECGAAALGILLGSYGRFIPLETLREKCGVSRDGSNSLNIIKAAEQFDLEGSGYSISLEDLLKVKEPVILFWGFNHFLVLEGFGKNKVYINDPAMGPRTISYEELDHNFTGIVLKFAKKDSFKKEGSPPRIFSILFRRLKQFPNAIAYLIIIGFCLLLPGLALPAFTRMFIDEIFVTNNTSWKWMFLLSILFAVFIAAVLNWIRQNVLNRLRTKLSIQYSCQFLWHLLRLPIRFFSQRYPGELSYRMTLNQNVALILTGPLATAAIDMLLVIFYAIVMLDYNLTIAFIGIISGLLNFLILILINRSRTDSYARLQQDIAKSFGYSVNGLQNIEIIKSTGGEMNFFSSWAGYYTKYINANQEIGQKDAILSTFPVFLQSLSVAVLLFIGGYEVLEGSLTIGTLMALQILLLNFLEPINRFVNFGQLLQNMKIDLMRLDDVHRYPIDKKYHEDKKIATSHEVQQKEDTSKEGKISELTGHIEFRDVTFGYSPLAPPLIENLSFTITPGKKLALVGHSGCGKSTIAKLALGLYEPWSGEILYDGLPLNQIPPEIRHRYLASVDQEIFIFQGTIKENVSLWDPTVRSENLIQATTDACIHEEILEKDKGYTYFLQEGGKNISGGQRQRMEIARALLTNPTILIVDEAMSALDSELEQKIAKNLKHRGCSMIMIAHRLSTIQDCEEILVLEHGKIVQSGTHTSLKNEEGIYKQLIENETLL